MLSGDRAVSKARVSRPSPANRAVSYTHLMDTSSSDSIGISKLIVTTDNPEDKIRIQKYLEEHLQIQTEVAVE